MPERIIYHNPDHIDHKGWIDNEGKPWDVPDRLFPVIDALLSDDATGRTEWFVVPEFHHETLDIIAKAHSTEMIEAIAQASIEATNEQPLKTRFDKGAESNSTAIYPGTFEQALMSAECAVSAADALTSGQTDLAITVSRPPGHHAGREFYHGFCYFNLAAVAAEAMKEKGKKVAILDFDVHHGDGTQDIFYDDPNVLYISLHADPNLVLPGTGYAHETGSDSANGTTVNYPFPIGVDRDTYMQLLTDANQHVQDFKPDYLIIEAGFDGHKDEFVNLPPITQLGDTEYREIGDKIGALKIPSLVIFGGGYNQDITANAFLSYIQGMTTEDQTQHPKLFTSDEIVK
jgi:acetoin utilization deacetylase AcuC-like enzyme